MRVCVHEGVCAWWCVSLNMCAPVHVCAHPLSPAAATPYKPPHRTACTKAATVPSQRRLSRQFSGPIRRPRARACPSLVFRRNPAGLAPCTGSSTASPLHHCRHLSSPLPEDSLSLRNLFLFFSFSGCTSLLVHRDMSGSSYGSSSSMASFAAANSLAVRDWLLIISYKA